MSKRKLPPLNVLRGFHAAGRHLSFTHAADELHVTQGAISRQVKDLEDFLGRPVFRRLTRRIEFTQDGAEFFNSIQDVFDQLEQAVTRFRSASDASTLTISALPTIASLWLMPRLHQFTQAHRHVDVRILSSIEPAELLVHEADIAIRVGRLPGQHYDRRQPRIELEMVRNWTDICADELLPDLLIPVCARSLIDQPLAGDELQRIVEHPLIHTSSRRYAWPDWLKAHGVRITKGRRDETEFGHFFMSLEAARKGRGIAIIPKILLDNFDGRRDIVELFPPSIPSAGAYHLLVHQSRLDNANVQAFRRWVMTEAEQARVGGH